MTVRLSAALAKAILTIHLISRISSAVKSAFVELFQADIKLHQTGIKAVPKLREIGFRAEMRRPALTQLAKHGRPQWT
jgi:hypothetical protein